MNAGVSIVLLLPYASAFALVAAERSGMLRARFPKLPGNAALWLCVTLAAYCVQLDAIYALATHPGAPARHAALPIPVVDLNAAGVDWIEAVLLLCGLVQSVAAIALMRRVPALAVTIAGAIATFALSLAAPAMTSADVYSNVGYALLGSAAYAPPAHSFSGEFAAIDAWWGTPMVAAPYGPAWLAIDAWATSPLPALVGKVLALRALGALALLGFAWALAAIGFPKRYVTGILLNPALAFIFIANAHNDAVAMVAVACAALALRRYAPFAGSALAVAALVAAALVKLPYALVGLPVLAWIRNGWLRAACVAAVIVLSLALSWWAGGPAYAGALLSHAAPMRGALGWHVIATLVAALLIAGAILNKRQQRTAVWLIPPAGGFYPAFVYPWYLAWSVAYALRRRRILAYWIVWFPFAAALMDQQTIRIWTIVLVFPLIAAFTLSIDKRRPSTSSG